MRQGWELGYECTGMHTSLRSHAGQMCQWASTHRGVCTTCMSRLHQGQARRAAGCSVGRVGRRKQPAFQG